MRVAVRPTRLTLILLEMVLEQMLSVQHGRHLLGLMREQRLLALVDRFLLEMVPEQVIRL